MSVDTSYCLRRIYLRLSARVSHEAKRGAVVIYYGVPRKSVAIAWQKDLFRFLPVGQGDSKYQDVFYNFGRVYPL